jgi:hypothetical protein
MSVSSDHGEGQNEGSRHRSCQAPPPCLHHLSHEDIRKQDRPGPALGEMLLWLPVSGLHNCTDQGAFGWDGKQWMKDQVPFLMPWDSLRYPRGMFQVDIWFWSFVERADLEPQITFLSSDHRTKPRGKKDTAKHLRWMWLAPQGLVS